MLIRIKNTIYCLLVVLVLVVATALISTPLLSKESGELINFILGMIWGCGGMGLWVYLDIKNMDKIYG